MKSFQILRVSEWIIKFAYINLLWICFSLLGGFIFGVFPATVAMFSVMRQWIKGHTDISVFQSFRSFFRKNFTQANFLGFIICVIAFTLFIDFKLLEHASGNFINMIHYLVLAITFLFIFTCFYVFPIFVSNDFSMLQLLKNAFLFMIVSPLSTIMIIASIVIHMFILQYYPGLIFVFGIGPIAFMMMWSTHLSYLNINRKKRIIGS